MNKYLVYVMLNNMIAQNSYEYLTGSIESYCNSNPRCYSCKLYIEEETTITCCYYKSVSRKLRKLRMYLLRKGGSM